MIILYNLRKSRISFQYYIIGLVTSFYLQVSGKRTSSTWAAMWDISWCNLRMMEDTGMVKELKIKRNHGRIVPRKNVLEFKMNVRILFYFKSEKFKTSRWKIPLVSSGISESEYLNWKLIKWLILNFNKLQLFLMVRTKPKPEPELKPNPKQNLSTLLLVLALGSC